MSERQRLQMLRWVWCVTIAICFYMNSGAMQAFGSELAYDAGRGLEYAILGSTSIVADLVGALDLVNRW